MNIGYLGPEYTFTHRAARHFTRGEVAEAKLHPINEIPVLFERLEAGVFDAIVVPDRNTIAGLYAATAEGLASGRTEMIDQTTFPIELFAGIHPDALASEITAIWSKDTALAECSEWRRRFCPNALAVEASSTSHAIRQIAVLKMQRTAGVGPEEAIQHYGLRTIAWQVQNPVPNETTFLLLQKKEYLD